MLEIVIVMQGRLACLRLMVFKDAQFILMALQLIFLKCVLHHQSWTATSELGTSELETFIHDRLI